MEVALRRTGKNPRDRKLNRFPTVCRANVVPDLMADLGGRAAQVLPEVAEAQAALEV
jgi:hypothetical protein